METLAQWFSQRAWGDIATGALISVPVGLLCGLYSGLVVARWAWFETLKNEVKRFIVAIDWMCEGKTVRYILHKPIVEIHWASSDLLFLKHKAAAEKVLEIQADVIAVSGRPQGAVHMTFDQANSKYIAWQQKCREMQPSWRVLLSLHPQL